MVPSSTKQSKKNAPVVTLTERFDYAALRYVIDHFDDMDFGNRAASDLTSLNKLLHKYMAAAKHDGSIVVNYYHSSKDTPGRLFAQGGLSLQGMKKEVRNTIAHTLYTDVDMQNAHPNLLLQFCMQKNISAPRLHEYCMNRSAILESLTSGCPSVADSQSLTSASGTGSGASGPRDAKTAMLVAINGGKTGSTHAWLAAFEEEMRNVREALVPLAPRQLKLAQSRAARKASTNVLGSMVNILLCEIENSVLLKLKEFFEDKGLKVGVLVFDGCMVERADGAVVTEELLQEASDVIYSATGYRIKLVVKDMCTHRLPVPESVYNSHIPVEPRYASDNAAAAQLFAKDIRDLVKTCRGRTYVHKGLVWSSEPVVVNRFLLARCMYANILRVKETNAGRRFLPMTGEIPEAKRVIEGSLALLPDDDTFEERLWSSCLGCICFKNGIYDFRKGLFQPYDERPDVMTTTIIPRDFPVNRPDPVVTQELMDRVFMSTLGSSEVVQYYLTFKARALAGEFRDKQWAVMLGERNCGKGLLQELDMAAFPGYVNEVNANSFLLKQFADSDASKALSWALDCEFTRLTYTNELRCDHSSRNIKLDGNLLKAFQSGGDGISARKNHKDERVFRVATRLFMNLNDIPEVTPKDAMTSMVMFKFPYKFVSAEEMAEKNMPFHRLRDDTLKDVFCHRPDVWDAYTWLLIDAYSPGRPSICTKVLEDTKEYLMDIGDEGTVMDQLFEYTGDRNDFVTLARIKEIASTYNLRKAAIKDRLVRLGGREDRSCCVGGVVHGRGINGVRECSCCMETDLRSIQVRDSTTSKSEERFGRALATALGYSLHKERPPWLKNPASGQQLELDFYDQARALAIEYDGPHHYEFPNAYHQTRAEFEHQQQLDRLKGALCALQGVFLIRVRAQENVREEVAHVLRVLNDHVGRSHTTS